ncbi:MAG: keto-deoxy-phosphogluconate aldolase, partial [Methylococcales bacterium]|nr:keto-deoxy-phosphogluconate aldolase [Methylococcales bacterium]
MTNPNWKVQPSTVLNASPVMPVMVIQDLENAVPLAKALVAGGIRVLEITLRTPVALDAIRAIAKEVPDAIVGAGTILNEQQLQAAADAGAVFAISPGLT